MAFYDWNERLSVGIDSIDRQHKVLIGYINTLADGVANGTINTIVGKVLNNLITYTKSHFMYEEMLLDQCQYRDCVEHKRHHTALIAKVDDFYSRFKRGESIPGVELLEFLKDWLNHHILKDDVAYSPTLKANGIK